MNILSTLFSFKGKISRKTYWLSIITLFVFIFMLAASVFALSQNPHEAAESFAPFFAILFLLVAISFFSLQVKRCHDIGWTGWLALLSFVPVVHWFWWCLLGIVTGNSVAEFKKTTQEYLVEKDKERKAKEEEIALAKS